MIDSEEDILSTELENIFTGMIMRYIESFPNGIDGIKFYMTSPASGDRNKGRICIDDIVLSLNPNDTDFLTGNYEAII